MTQRRGKYYSTTACIQCSHEWELLELFELELLELFELKLLEFLD